MTGMFRFILLTVAALTASACGIRPVQHAGVVGKPMQCEAIRRRVMVDAPPAEGLLPPGGMKSIGGVVDGDQLARDIEALYASGLKSGGDPQKALGEDEPITSSMLLLSGGSQNGAFGAGFLSAWSAARGEGLPRFRLVTGISTGALQSTFAFLDQAPRIRAEYEITREGQLLRPFTKGGLKSESRLKQAEGVVSLLRRGAVAELEPLRARLRQLIDRQVLLSVAHQAGTVGAPDQRMLLVGAVEMDTGDAFAFDLTEAARRYAAGDEGMRDCYIEALMASSSVPMAALPVFIDGRMYIDGGARFGVIADFAGTLFQKVSRSLPADAPRNMFILVNGTLEVTQACHLKDCDRHPLPPAPSGQVPEYGQWSFDKLALRSLAVLINQSYRSSVFWARTNSKELGFTPHFVRIEARHQDHHATLDFDAPGERLSCRDWKKRDEERDAPVEFHPRFMRCLIDYGSTRADVGSWVAAER